MLLTETAYAKINLALHIRGRRDDGYHELETVFAFVDAGDVLTARSAPGDTIVTQGEFSRLMGPARENLVARALALLPHEGGIELTVEKNLPVAAGLGGGSADAGAVFRLIRTMQGLPEDWPRMAGSLGADVPACVDSVTCIGRGIGTQLEPLPAASITGTPVLLVNPRLPLATKSVFARWEGHDRGPLGEGDVRQIAWEGRNDLEEPAVDLCPAIGWILKALRETGAELVRMSGSGATCFGLYSNPAQRDEAARQIARLHPGWWQMAGALR